MAETLRRIIGQLRSESDALQAASTSMVSATERAVNLSGEQQQQVDQVATAMNELSASADEVARHAAETARATHEADEQGNTAKVVVVEAMGAVDVLADMVQGAAEVIGRLEQESENIGKVLAVINDIAEQTNLLALNAAIEAARAGEQGRGFAVVADEVRTLANRTQKSTEEISAMIERLQGGSREAVSAMEAGRDQATNGVALTEQAAEALAVIAGAITTISEMSEQIAQASREQTTVVEDVNRSVSAISGLCDRTTESMGHIDGTARELARLADEMQGLIAGFRTA
ncbi:MAG TPA: methyl-accepting chemotaxis protein [Rhodospirillales bacterium]|nr:methyl-accepting chemotaxis protein [Rhodospirillales bacterium]